LTMALDSWANDCNAGRRDDEMKRLLAVARGSDADETRNQVRQALEHRNTKVLTELAASAKISDLPKEALGLLGQGLYGTVSVEQAVTVLRRAQQQYPDDYWINHDLAWDLNDLPGAPIDDVVRFYTVARALRPRDIGVHLRLSEALGKQGKLDEAF